MAGEEKPPIVVLSVVVIEAEGLEAKDANGKQIKGQTYGLYQILFSSDSIPICYFYFYVT